MASRKHKSKRKRNAARFNPAAASLAHATHAPRTIQDKRRRIREAEADEEARKC